MNHAQVQDWLDRYIGAWRSNDTADVAGLFSEDVVYSYRPWVDDEVAVSGRDAVVASWLENPDDPEGWEASYSPYAVDGNKAVATGWSRYLPTDDVAERLYHNAYLLEFDDEGRCSSFREFFFLKKN
ncbi:MAG TPA: nuclear transport factor 2 family protein [Acidimicrobiia bacterium]|nr:nuclear transport factor 2 family protein [Acidimicrobiia bacterium]